MSSHISCSVTLYNATHKRQEWWISPSFLCFSAAVPRGPRCVQAALTGRDPEDKERKEAETERKEAESDRKPKASGQCPSSPEKPSVCGWALTATRRAGGEYTEMTN